MNRFKRKYRLHGLTGDLAIKICYYIVMDTQVANSFPTFYTIYTVMKTRIAGMSITRRNMNMLNINVEIMNYDVSKCYEYSKR